MHSAPTSMKVQAGPGYGLVRANFAPTCMKVQAGPVYGSVRAKFAPTCMKVQAGSFYGLVRAKPAPTCMKSHPSDEETFGIPAEGIVLRWVAAKEVPSWQCEEEPL